MVVSVNREGEFFIDIGEGKMNQWMKETLVTRVAAVIKYKPKTPIMVRGDPQCGLWPGSGGDGADSGLQASQRWLDHGDAGAMVIVKIPRSGVRTAPRPSCDHLF